MNKIDDLMYEAGLTAQGCWDEMDEYNRTAIMKFAELIVDHCTTIMGDAMKNTEHYDLAYNAMLTGIISDIYKSLGMKTINIRNVTEKMQEAFKNGVDLSGKETP